MRMTGELEDRSELLDRAVALKARLQVERGDLLEIPPLAPRGV